MSFPSNFTVVGERSSAVVELIESIQETLQQKRRQIEDIQSRMQSLAREYEQLDAEASGIAQQFSGIMRDLDVDNSVQGHARASRRPNVWAMFGHRKKVA
jgi:chromosome segregation ATPase